MCAGGTCGPSQAANHITPPHIKSRHTEKPTQASLSIHRCTDNMHVHTGGLAACARATSCCARWKKRGTSALRSAVVSALLSSLPWARVFSAITNGSVDITCTHTKRHITALCLCEQHAKHVHRQKKNRLLSFGLIDANAPTMRTAPTHRQSGQ